MKAYGGAEVLLPVLITLALRGSEWSASHSGHFSHGEKNPAAHG